MSENRTTVKNTKVCKAVVPVAGLGTRFLPATKATPKEMLPVVDKPAIQYVIEEAVRAGLQDVLMVTGRNKTPLEDHFDRVEALEHILDQKGDTEKLEAVRHATNLADIHYIRQGDPLGLGHAILKGAQHVGREPFAVLLGDDLIEPKSTLLDDMIRVQQETGGCVVGLMEVPLETINRYGNVATEATQHDGVVKVTRLVEKPDPDEAPSNLAIIGRYVLAPEIFDILHDTPPGRGGEIQITDALQTAASDPALPDVYGVVLSGRRYDTGDKLSYLKAVIEIAGERPDLGGDLRAWLRDYVAGLDS